MTTKLVYLQLETCHANTNGTAWYAYFTEECDTDQVAAAIGTRLQDRAPLGFELESTEEVCTPLSEYAGLRRFYVGSAV